MNSPVLISSACRADLEVVSKFFGIDMAWSDHLFRHAAQVDTRAFEVVIKSLAEAIRQDVRYGTGDRIRQRIAAEKGNRR